MLPNSSLSSSPSSPSPPPEINCCAGVGTEGALLSWVRAPSPLRNATLCCSGWTREPSDWCYSEPPDCLRLTPRGKPERLNATETSIPDKLGMKSLWTRRTTQINTEAIHHFKPVSTVNCHIPRLYEQFPARLMWGDMSAELCSREKCTEFSSGEVLFIYFLFIFKQYFTAIYSIFCTRGRCGL